MDTEFGAYFAARAAKVPYELMDYLSAGDYMAVSQDALNFLLTPGFSEQEAREIKAAAGK